jgi:hypothetical protein
MSTKRIVFMVIGALVGGVVGYLGACAGGG